eukprot:GGOE01004706.1.p1 GENE.GGOE01004706.1~~GGOE01004706.1.p1  ORF type:complete len:413 (+),score=18.70 GGOE01004706.1:53-1291(+)
MSLDAPTVVRGKCVLPPHVPGDGGVLSKAQILMEKLIRRDGPHPSIKSLTEAVDGSFELPAQKAERPSRLDKPNLPGCQQRRRSSGGDARMQALCQRMQEERVSQSSSDEVVSPAKAACPIFFPKPRITIHHGSPSPCSSPVQRSPRFLTSPAEWEHQPVSPDSAHAGSRQISSSPTGLSSQTVSDAADVLEEPTSSRGVQSPRSSESPPHTPTGTKASHTKLMQPTRLAFPTNMRKSSMPNVTDISQASGLNGFPAYNGPLVKSMSGARGDYGRPTAASKSPPPSVMEQSGDKLRTWTHGSPGRRTQSANPTHGRRPPPAAITGTPVRAPIVAVPTFLPPSPPLQAMAAKAMSLPKHSGPNSMPMRNSPMAPTRRRIFSAFGQRVPEPTAVISPTLTQYTAALNGSAPVFV